MTYEPDADDEFEAEVFALQAIQWMRACNNKEVCPAARVFIHLIAAQRKIQKLEHEIQRIRNFEDER